MATTGGQKRVEPPAVADTDLYGYLHRQWPDRTTYLPERCRGGAFTLLLCRDGPNSTAPS